MDRLVNWVRRYWAGLVAVAWMIPLAAAVATLAAWIADSNHSAVLRDVAEGLVSAAVAWLVLGLGAMPASWACVANRSSYDELRQRLKRLQPPDEIAKSKSAQWRAIAKAYHDEVQGLLCKSGLQWTIAYGYIDAWRRVHHCEEELLELTTSQELAEEIAMDRLRLEGSQVPNAKELNDLLTAADTALKSTNLVRRGLGALKSTPTAISLAPRDARSKARTVRRTINDFRDSSWEEMARIRNRSMTALLVAGTVGYLLLATALLFCAPAKALVSALAFFLVAAIVGLINAIQALAQLDSAVEDYGLANARLVGTPVISGLTGLGGVLLIGLSAGLSAALVTTGTTSAARVAAGPVTVPPLTEILDVQGHPVGLAIAALFGLTPALFLGRLNALVQQYNVGLASSEPAGTSARVP